MTPRRCCCPQTCPIAEDAFGRADSNPPSGDWKEISGEWEIASNVLNCITEGPLITTVRQPKLVGLGTGKYNYKVFVDLLGVNTTHTEWKVIIGYTDASNYQYVWFKYETNYTITGVWPYFMNVSAGVTTTVTSPADWSGSQPLDNTAPTDVLRVKICYADLEWTVDNAESGDGEAGDGGAGSVNQQYNWTLCDSGLDDLPLDPDIGAVGFLSGKFDNWKYYYHYESLTLCDWCSCICDHPTGATSDYSCYPETLNVQVTRTDSESYTCSDLDSYGDTLNQGYFDGGSATFKAIPAKVEWTNQTQQTGTPEEFFVTFQCDGAKLFFASADTNNALWLSGLDYETPNWSKSTCKPLKLVYEFLSSLEEQCEINGPGTGAPYGIRPSNCPNGACLDDTIANQNLIAAMRWTVTLTE